MIVIETSCSEFGTAWNTPNTVWYQTLGLKSDVCLKLKLSLIKLNVDRMKNEIGKRIWSKLHRFQRFSLWFCMAYLYSSSNLVSTFSSYIYYVKMCFFTSFMSWSLAGTSYLKDVTDSFYCCIALCSQTVKNINFRFLNNLELVLLLIKVRQ